MSVQVSCSLLFVLRSLLNALRSLLTSLYQTNASSGVWNPNYDSEKLVIEKWAPIMQSSQGQVMIKLKMLEGLSLCEADQRWLAKTTAVKWNLEEGLLSR